MWARKNVVWGGGEGESEHVFPLLLVREKDWKRFPAKEKEEERVERVCCIPSLCQTLSFLFYFFHEKKLFWERNKTSKKYFSIVFFPFTHLFTIRKKV